MSQFINIKKNQRQDVVVKINLVVLFALPALIIKSLSKKLFHLIASWFQFLELIYQRKLLLGLAGLGLGFGFSIIVWQRPAPSWATMEVSGENEAGQVITIGLPNYFEASSVGVDDRSKPLCLAKKPQQLSGNLLNLSTPMVIGGCSNREVFQSLSQVSLGEEIILTGQNHGQYHFHIIEIKEVDADTLNQLISQQTSAVIIFTPTNLLATSFLAVLAK